MHTRMHASFIYYRQWCSWLLDHFTLDRQLTAEVPHFSSENRDVSLAASPAGSFVVVRATRAKADMSTILHPKHHGGSERKTVAESSVRINRISPLWHGGMTLQRFQDCSFCLSSNPSILINWILADDFVRVGKAR
jgi:predicted Rdx family selenoprotein